MCGQRRDNTNADRAIYLEELYVASKGNEQNSVKRGGTQLGCLSRPGPCTLKCAARLEPTGRRQRSILAVCTRLQAQPTLWAEIFLSFNSIFSLYKNS